MDFRVCDTTISVNMHSAAELVAETRDRFVRGHGFALATLNLDHLVKLRGDAAFRRAYAAHDLICADGNPVVWLSHLAGQPVELVPGSDLVVPLSRAALESRRAVALVGSTPDALAGAAAYLRRVLPGLQIADAIAPPFGFNPDGDEATRILERVAQSGAGLCFIALGAPKQERLAARGRVVAPGVGFASVGAGLDFLAGRQRRAPQLVRMMALEWAWRLVTDPKRMTSRYAACAAILPSEAMRAIRQRSSA